MNWQTFKTEMKAIPPYLADGCRSFYDYWRKASLRMWVAETLWLTILVAMFYYGIYGTIEFVKTATIVPDSALSFFLSTLPLWFVLAIFMAHWGFSSLVKTIFGWMDNANRDNT